MLDKNWHESPRANKNKKAVRQTFRFAHIWFWYLTKACVETQLTGNELLWHLLSTGGGHTVKGELLYLHNNTCAHQFGKVVENVFFHRWWRRRLRSGRAGSIHSGIRSGLCTSTALWILLRLLVSRLCLLTEICSSWKVHINYDIYLTIRNSKRIFTFLS